MVSSGLHALPPDCSKASLGSYSGSQGSHPCISTTEPVCHGTRTPSVCGPLFKLQICPCIPTERGQLVRRARDWTQDSHGPGLVWRSFQHPPSPQCVSFSACPTSCCKLFQQQHYSTSRSVHMLSCSRIPGVAFLALSLEAAVSGSFSTRQVGLRVRTSNIPGDHTLRSNGVFAQSGVTA